ncbi:MAG: SymE family type I addiction module toxin [Verrucomicrobiota bacterium]
MKPRTLKIETAGDGWRGQVIPKIRLAGQWLERAGFKPGNRVTIQISGQGTLTLRFVERCPADTASTQIPPVSSYDTTLTPNR